MLNSSLSLSFRVQTITRVCRFVSTLPPSASSLAQPPGRLSQALVIVRVPVLSPCLPIAQSALQMLTYRTSRAGSPVLYLLSQLPLASHFKGTVLSAAAVPAVMQLSASASVSTSW